MDTACLVTFELACDLSIDFKIKASNFGYSLICKHSSRHESVSLHSKDHSNPITRSNFLKMLNIYFPRSHVFSIRI